MDAGPGDKVPAGLLAHVHLLSAHSYPLHQQPLSLDSVLTELLNAPRIVGSQKSVAWQYLAPPRDGSILLAWQPTAQMGNTYASDGFIFAEPEQMFRQTCRDYTIEIFLFDGGYIPTQREPIATHRRVRYRLAASPSGEPVDSHLELVHYTASPPEKHLPSQSVPVTPNQRKLLHERTYLEEQGTLVRKEFMLQDQSNWPAISQPGRPSALPPNPYQRGPLHPGGYPPGPRPPGPPQPPYNQMGAPRPSGIGPSPAKRARHAGPPRPDVPAVEDDEALNQAGDALDLLSPREISITRYTQHHEWMEEVLSSPYAVSRILPVDLGFKLGGELSELTNGLFENDQPSDQPHTIDDEQVKELERRVSEFQRKGREDIAQMKAQHQAKMKQMSEQRLFVQLEQRLAKAAFDDEDGAGGESVEDIMREVESATGAQLRWREEMVQVQKGGLLAPEETLATRDPPTTNDGNNQASQNQGDEFLEYANLDSAGEALDFYSGSYNDTGYAT